MSWVQPIVYNGKSSLGRSWLLSERDRRKKDVCSDNVMEVKDKLGYVVSLCTQCWCWSYWNILHHHDTNEENKR